MFGFGFVRALQHRSLIHQGRRNIFLRLTENFVNFTCFFCHIVMFLCNIGTKEENNSGE